ncbi:MAG: efflux RND transporter permease subunit [Gammaproteobacteria bacterium]|nr:efflux RND transporter permease subunit [Gammaproteobacteria bacterium]
MIAFFTRHPTAGNLLMLFLAVLGLIALPGLQRETFPDFAAQELQVTVAYPGASAEDIEESICQRLEDAIDGISDVAEMRCEAREGAAIAVVELEDGGDFARFMDDVRTEVEAIDSFPEQTESPVIKELGRTDDVAAIAVTGPMSVSDLKAYAEQIKERIQRLPQVPQVEIAGFSDHQLQISVSAQALRQHGLSMTDVADAVARQGVDQPAGSLETHERDILIRFTDQRRTPAALAELVVVGAESGAELRLGQIATISDRFEDEEEKLLFNGSRAALLKVTKTKQQDTLAVMDELSGLVDELRATAPAGVALTITQDRSSIVRDRLQLLLKNGAQGLVLVFLAMWLFFQGRFAFWVAMGMPVSFLGALFCMSALGLTINMITMVALLIAIGLLMDDAIVIAENIAARLRRGDPPFQAALTGTRQVAPGVLSSFLTTIAVFGPLAFLSGHMGKVLQFIPMVLILVIAVSLIEAFLILPHHLAHSLRHHQQRESRFRHAFDQRLEHFRDHTLGRLIDWAVAQRYWFVGGIVALFILSIGMLVGGKLKFEAFPDVEGDIIQARLLLPQGTPLWRTEAVVAQIIRGLEQVDDDFQAQQPAGARLVQNVQTRFNYNQDASETGPHLATITVDLLTAERRVGRLDDIINRWRAATGRVPDQLALSFKEPSIGPGGIPLELRLSGADLGQLKQASVELQRWLARYDGVFDVSDDLRPGKPELRLKLRDGALGLGLDVTTIARQLQAAFQGVTAREIQRGSEAYEIEVKLAAEDRRTLTAFEDFRITTASGDQVPLAVVANISLERGLARINRINGVRTVTVSGDLDPRISNAAEIIRHTRNAFLPELQQRYPGIDLSVQGQAQESAKTGASMLRGFAVGMIIIFILLSFQFRSYSQPLVVMSVIPMALIGVIWGHLAMGLNLTMPGIIGFTSLAGIVVNDSILLVEFLKMRVREGHPVEIAARMASRERFRAVLLTSLTTIAGLLPLLSESSLQAQILIPLATSIVFGLAMTTLLVLLVVPTLFTILSDLGVPIVAEDDALTEQRNAAPLPGT